MHYFIIIVLILSLFHFVYESIILPSIRLKLRYSLFALRDELRWIKYTYSDDVNFYEVFNYVENSINNMTKILSIIDIGRLYNAHQVFLKDRALNFEVKRRIQLLDECQLEEIKNIRKKMNAIFEYAILANSGAWFIYILPIFVLFLCFKQLKKLIKQIGQIICIPENEMEKIIPLPDLAPIR